MTIDIQQTLSDHELWLRGKGGARANLSWANLREANLRDANLSGADLRGADLRGADLLGADLREADLRGANLRRASLRRANLREANLSWADLREANLSWADLRGADLRGANLSWANLREANLSWANLSEGLTLMRCVGHASRGDQYAFYAFESSLGEPFIFAGCRAMLRSEYDAHIEETYPDTSKAEATRACLDYLCGLRPGSWED
ncbi:MAG: hypothetical protein PWP11_3279 [Thauera sp.]|nr:pentapeptide repeat-containing protein [Thauera sp.]MDI3492002.1 hypothetical protein [Thauera sp.]